MNLGDIMNNPKLKKSFEKMQSYVPDPHLTIFSIEREAFLLEDGVWAYLAPFVLKHENAEEKVMGKLCFYYFPNGNIAFRILPYDERILTEEQIKCIETSVTTHSRYVEMIQLHYSFISDLRYLFENTQSVSWDKWEVKSNKKDAYSFFTTLRVGELSFDLFLDVSKQKEEIAIQTISIAQEDETYNKAFEISTIMQEKNPHFYTKWKNEVEEYLNENN